MPKRSGPKTKSGGRLPPGDTPDVYRELLSPKTVFQDKLRKQFGDWLYRTILMRGESQSDFARGCGLPRDSISTYVLGKVLPSPSSAKKIADYLGMNVDEMLKMPRDTSVVIGANGHTPLLDIQTLAGTPARARVRLDRIVRLSSALAIAEIIEKDDAPANAG